MLFDQLPSSILGVLMALSCAIKHVALRRIVLSEWYQKLTRQHLWWLAAFWMAVCGSALAYLIFDRFVGLPTAAYLTAVDFAMNLAIGIYVRMSRLFEKQKDQFQQVVWWVRFICTLVYASYIWFTLV